MYESSIYFNFYKISFVIVKIAMQNITLYRFYLRSIQITQPNFLKILVIIDGAEILISHLEKKVFQVSLHKCNHSTCTFLSLNGYLNHSKLLRYHFCKFTNYKQNFQKS